MWIQKLAMLLLIYNQSQMQVRLGCELRFKYLVNLIY